MLALLKTIVLYTDISWYLRAFLTHFKCEFQQPQHASTHPHPSLAGARHDLDLRHAPGGNQGLINNTAT